MEIVCQSILDFWFGDNPYANSEKWFKKDSQFDALILKKFGEYMDHGFMGAFDRWATDPIGRTALIILLDQFPRNSYRNQARSFHYDKKAIALAVEGIERKDYLQCPPAYGYFMLMPTMHSEDIETQNLGIKCFEELTRQVSDPKDQEMISTALKYAKKHQEIIERFGRFPHRNDILERDSTPEEIEFLKTPGSSF